MESILVGAIATASLIAGLFFFRFWRSTRDRFFLLFALSFWIEAADRLVLYNLAGADEDAPVYYVIRLVTYGLILAAIVGKNRGAAAPAREPR